MEVPSFWLLDQDGRDFGMFGTDSHVLTRGEQVTSESGICLRVVESTPTAYTADFDGYLIVERADAT